MTHHYGGSGVHALGVWVYKCFPKVVSDLGGIWAYMGSILRRECVAFISTEALSNKLTC